MLENMAFLLEGGPTICNEKPSHCMPPKPAAQIREQRSSCLHAETLSSLPRLHTSALSFGLCG